MFTSGQNIHIGVTCLHWGKTFTLGQNVHIGAECSHWGTWVPLPAQDITVPFSVLEVAVNVANVLAAPLAGLLLMLDGAAGLRGWQWLFVAEGAPSIALGLLTFLLLPNTVQSADWLTGAEKKWLSSKVRPAGRLGACGPRGTHRATRASGHATCVLLMGLPRLCSLSLSIARLPVITASL